MAYTFAAASSQYLSATASPLGTGQLADHTLAFWVRAANAATTTLLAMSRSTETTSTNNPAVLVQINGDYLRYFMRANSSSTGVGWANLLGTSGAVVFNSTWRHCVCRLSDSATVSTATTYVDGAQNQSVAYGSATPATTGLDRFGVCALVRGNVSSYSSASVADVGVWNVALTTDEIASLARGVTCEQVRPQSLVFYAPLIRNIGDMARSIALTNNNTATVADHPRVYA